jgi:hypothetical protein
MNGQNIGSITPYNPRKQPGVYGAPSFFNGNPTASGTNNFNHNGSANTAATTSTGTAVSQDFNFPLSSPLTSAGNNHRPFSLNSTSASPPEWSQTSFSSLRTTLSEVEAYYNSSVSGCVTSDLVRIASGTAAYAYFQPNGMAPQGNFGTAQIGKLALVNLLRSFMTLGQATPTAAAVPQVPLVTVSSPAVTDEFDAPSSITVVWASTWTRWDGQKYTSAYSSYSGPALTYNLKVSMDGGSTWQFINASGTKISSPAAKAGVLNASYAVTSPINWNVSSSATYPQGNYVLRVEAFRNGRGLHYSHHERDVFIKR